MRRVDNVAARAVLALLPLAGISGASLLVTDSIDDDTVAGPRIELLDAGPQQSLFELDVDLSSVRTPDCFDVPGASEDLGGLFAAELPAAVVTCDEPHRYQVYGDFELPFASDYVFDDVQKAADRECFSLFTSVVGVTDSMSAFTFGYIYPDEAAWPGDRQVRCFLFLENEGLYKGDARDSNY